MRRGPDAHGLVDESALFQGERFHFGGHQRWLYCLYVLHSFNESRGGKLACKRIFVRGTHQSFKGEDIKGESRELEELPSLQLPPWIV
jgi:hypothetical protein